MQDTIDITILYFAMFREQVCTQREQMRVPSGTVAGEILGIITQKHPALTHLSATTLVMVNEVYADDHQVLADGDEIALIPPVSGGDPRFTCTEDVLDARAIEALVAADDAGAIVTFTGTVRNHARGREVISLEYEAYPPAATKMLAQVGTEVQEQRPGVRIAIAHRYGHLLPGDVSVVIACSSAHRDDAYSASAWAIARIKQIVPIWKKEHYRDGSAWVGSEHAYQVETGRIAEE